MEEPARDEFVLLGLLGVFAAIWITIIQPYLSQSQIFANLNPVLQYILFNVGFIMFAIIMINIPYLLAYKEHIGLSRMLRVGFAGWLLFSFIFDLWQPPYFLSSTGQVLITVQQALPNTAVDAMLSWVWGFIISPSIMIDGLSLLYIAVYGFTPVIATLAMIFILKPDAFRRLVLRQDID